MVNLVKMVNDGIYSYNPPPRWGILGGQGGGLTGFCHNTPLKMNLSCVSC